MRAWMALLAVLPACGFHSSEANDAKVDSPPDAQACFGSLAFTKVCFTAVPTTPVMITDAATDIDTDAGTSNGTPPLLCDQHNDQMAKYCVIAGAGFTVSAGTSLRAHGSKPLVLLSTTTIDLQGTVDVSSNHNPGPTNIGAGAASASSCTGATPATGNSGGYGGSFGGQGGDGEQLTGAGEAKGGAAAPVSFPTVLRGGCPGGAGSTTIAGATAGTGGSGGGAVAIIAAEVHLGGKINASGSGGHGGSPNKQAGGGGGGSGGMIVLDVPSIMVGGTGVLFANGGGGGQGGAGPGSKPGMGDDGQEPMAPMTQASGGAADTDGGTGGGGSYGGARLNGGNGGVNQAAQNMGGGGAGGGGAGFIHALGVTGDSIIAPPSSL